MARRDDAVHCWVPGDLETAIECVALDNVAPIVLLPRGVLTWSEQIQWVQLAFLRRSEGFHAIEHDHLLMEPVSER